MSRTTALCAALLLVPVLSTATVIRVPADVGAIDDALVSAAPHDSILVAAGTYFVNLEWPATPGLKLMGEGGAHETILDGRDDVQVIGIYTGVDSTTVVRGFTIRNGHAEGQ
jgi:hypothetical protein